MREHEQPGLIFRLHLQAETGHPSGGLFFFHAVSIF